LLEVDRGGLVLPSPAAAVPAGPRIAAVDLKIRQVVDAPNMLVSAFLPEDIFVS
jgi:hypothetical protein